MSPDRRVIVVGVDGSAASIEALRWAAGTADATGAELAAVTCWDYPPSYGMSAGYGDWNPAADARSIVDQAITAAFPEPRADTIRTTVTQGHPAEILIEASRNADMLVVGSRGRGGFVGLLLGSVSAYCAEHALCPVVVVRPRPTPSAEAP